MKQDASSQWKANDFIAHIRRKDGEKQSVAAHLIETARLASRFAAEIGMERTGELLGILHDFGKYSAEFQTYIRSATGYPDPDCEECIDAAGQRGRIDHSTAGAQIVLSKAMENGMTEYVSQILSLCLVSHHSSLIDCIAPNGAETYLNRIRKEDKLTHRFEAENNCDSTVKEKADELLRSSEILQELKRITKKIPRNRREWYFGLLARFLLSCLLDADRIDTADFEHPENRNLRWTLESPPWDKFIEVLERRLASFECRNRVDEIRSEISNACQKAGVKRSPGIYTLTVPTGGGKTLSSLRFALEHAAKYKLRRIFYIIPYTTIIDQNAREIRRIFAKLSEEFGTQLVLEHHSNLTPEPDSDEEEKTAHRIMAESWNAPIVLTTSVQFLESLFKGGTKTARRMHSLARSVIIFDEVQTLPVKIVHLFNNAVNFLVDVCASTAVMCTATQPLLHRVDSKKGAIKLSPDSEIIDDIDSLFSDLKRVEVMDRTKPGGWADQEIATLVESELAKTGSALVVVNTKRSAARLFSMIQDLTPHVYHLSTAMCPEHRLGVIDKIRLLARPGSREPVVCVSTQLIEAGVDIDFGSVIRYTAGLDSIAQAAGRCNRSGMRPEGRVTIVNPTAEHIESIPEIIIGKQKVERLLAEFQNNPSCFGNSLLGPQAIERYFQYYFFHRQQEMEYDVTHAENVQRDTLLSMLGVNQRAIINLNRAGAMNLKIPLRQSFKSAGALFRVIDSAAQGIIVPHERGVEIIAGLSGSNDITGEKELLTEAQRYSVSCFANTLRDLEREGAIVDIQGSGILCLQEGYYDSHLGVTTEYCGRRFCGA